MPKLMVKVLKEGMPDLYPFTSKQTKQPVPKSQAPSNQEFLPSVDPSKYRYYDRKRCAEINLERCLDTLFCRVQQVTREPPSDWESPY